MAESRGSYRERIDRLETLLSYAEVFIQTSSPRNSQWVRVKGQTTRRGWTVADIVVPGGERQLFHVISSGQLTRCPFSRTHGAEKSPHDVQIFELNELLAKQSKENEKLVSELIDNLQKLLPEPPRIRPRALRPRR